MMIAYDTVVISSIFVRVWRRRLLFAIEKRGEEIVSGAIEAATEVGGDSLMTIKSTVYGIVKAGSDGKYGYYTIVITGQSKHD